MIRIMKIVSALVGLMLVVFVAKYAYKGYPSNPNGSDYNTSMMCDKTGRHLVMMPHIERSTFPWNWAFYPTDRKDEVSPWIEAFVNARKWITKE